MKFEPLHYPDKIRVINPSGDVGIVTLWTPIKQMVKSLWTAGIDLSIHTSRIATIGNLYGNGLPELLRNLLWNPQIRHLLIVGQNLSGSREDLLNFFQQGIEEVTYLGSPAYRIKGSQRMIDNLVTPADFKYGLHLLPMGRLSESIERIKEAFQQLPNTECHGDLDRVNIPLSRLKVTRYPSDPRHHSILESTPIKAWREVVFRLMRFGHAVRLKKGGRRELQNVKVTVTDTAIDMSDLEDYGFSTTHFLEYQNQILDPSPNDQPYTYGNRIRGYFSYHGRVVDSLAIAIKRLQEDNESRHTYISLWDNSKDLPEGHHCPCLVSLFFRYFEGKLTLTASFRTHNAMDAWLENMYGLIAILHYVAKGTGMEPGAITIFSHSISISEDSLDRASRVASKEKRVELQLDPYGNMMVTVDKTTSQIVVQHTYQGAVIKEYRGSTSEAIERELARDEAISDISHALYVGRELARAENRLGEATPK